MPPPTPTPTPTPTPSGGQPIEIFNNPASQEFTTLTSGDEADALRIRYDAGSGIYEVLVGANESWEGLRPHPDYQSNPNQYFAYGATDRNEMSFLFTAVSYQHTDDYKYDYANIAVWGSGVGAYWDDANYTAFGMATPAGGVPVTGSASYSGKILGATDFREPDYLIGGTVAATIGGTIDFSFDFGAGTLAGSMNPILYSFSDPMDLGVFTFKDTVYSTGATSFSGKFDTNVAGTNSFDGIFAGPSAQELMGRWNLPFRHPTSGDVHAAWGAFVAKR